MFILPIAYLHDLHRTVVLVAIAALRVVTHVIIILSRMVPCAGGRDLRLVVVVEVPFCHGDGCCNLKVVCAGVDAWRADVRGVHNPLFFTGDEAVPCVCVERVFVEGGS